MVKKKSVKKKSSKKRSKARVSVKKTSKKKAPAKKKTTMPKTNVKKHELIIKCWSENAKPSKCFAVADGKQLKNIKELVRALEKMEDHIFSHHVNWDRNDFYNWVNDVFKETELAEKILDKHDRKDMLLTFYKELVDELLK